MKRKIIHYDLTNSEESISAEVFVIEIGDSFPINSNIFFRKREFGLPNQFFINNKENAFNSLTRNESVEKIVELFSNRKESFYDMFNQSLDDESFIFHATILACSLVDVIRS